MTVLRRFRDARVVVADDNVANVRMLEAMLRREGLWDVRSTTDSVGIVDLVESVDADLLLLDLHMPKMDGYTVLAELAERTGGDFIPVLVLTADTTREAVHRALTLGAHDFVAKPFDATEVVLRVRNMLETRLLYRTLRAQNAALAEELQRRLDLDRDVERHARELAERIERVIAHHELSVVFQPIVQMPGREVVGMEALSRFSGQPSRGPDQWFDEAAAVGMGPQLEMVAINGALAQLERLPNDAFLAVNVSPELVLTGDLRKAVPDDVCRRLVLELTEHVEVEDYEPIRRAIEPLRALGTRIAVDDTGAGFASLRHILLLEPDIIKLDRSLTRGVDVDPARRALAASMVSFADEVGADLIAEGVETEGELTALTQLGARWMQGFHIAYPAALDAP